MILYKNNLLISLKRKNQRFRARQPKQRLQLTPQPHLLHIQTFLLRRDRRRRFFGRQARGVVHVRAALSEEVRGRCDCPVCAPGEVA